MWIGVHPIVLPIDYYALTILDVTLPQDFQILDSEDQLRLVKRLMKLHKL